jgi:hypothetical protein
MNPKTHASNATMRTVLFVTLKTLGFARHVSMELYLLLMELVTLSHHVKLKTVKFVLETVLMLVINALLDMPRLYKLRNA